tara:strand:+ start:1054 stop:1419 length:366 start_codon:yes stop_codon:yes gene_type:complete
MTDSTSSVEITARAKAIFFHQLGMKPGCHCLSLATQKRIVKLAAVEITARAKALTAQAKALTAQAEAFTAEVVLEEPTYYCDCFKCSGTGFIQASAGCAKRTISKNGVCSQCNGSGQLSNK